MVINFWSPWLYQKMSLPIVCKQDHYANMFRYEFWSECNDEWGGRALLQGYGALMDHSARFAVCLTNCQKITLSGDLTSLLLLGPMMATPVQQVTCWFQQRARWGTGCSNQRSSSLRLLKSPPGYYIIRCRRIDNHLQSICFFWSVLSLLSSLAVSCRLWGLPVLDQLPNCLGGY